MTLLEEGDRLLTPRLARSSPVGRERGARRGEDAECCTSPRPENNNIGVEFKPPKALHSIVPQNKFQTENDEPLVEG